MDPRTPNDRRHVQGSRDGCTPRRQHGHENCPYRVVIPKCLGLVPTIVGTGNPDTINGTNGRDIIVGLGGSDTINGGGGNDVICGNDGNDDLSGGDGNDVLDGGPGNDSIRGDPRTRSLPQRRDQDEQLHAVLTGSEPAPEQGQSQLYPALTPTRTPRARSSADRAPAVSLRPC